MTITHRTATMRKLSTLLASTSLVTTHAFLYTHVFSSYLSSTAGNSLSANKSYKLSHSEFRSGSRNSKCARMNQTRDNSSSNERITLESMVESLKKGDYKNILIVAGAGVSCSAGIPDFRTPGSGIYDNLHKYNLPYPEAIFDVDFYRQNPMPFVTLSKEIWPGVKYSLLGKKGILQRIYTQNIDGLEAIAGVDPTRLVECHGHFRSATCINCGAAHDADDCKRRMVEQGEAPICIECGNLVKPTIVFFGEVMPGRFGQLIHSDVESCDLVVVLGTSLQVAPVASIPNWVKSDIPRLLVNREKVGSFQGNFPTDVFLEGDCDESIRKLSQLAGWEEELNQIYSEIHSK